MSLGRERLLGPEESESLPSARGLTNRSVSCAFFEVKMIPFFGPLRPLLSGWHQILPMGSATWALCSCLSVHGTKEYGRGGRWTGNARRVTFLFSLAHTLASSCTGRSSSDVIKT